MALEQQNFSRINTAIGIYQKWMDSGDIRTKGLFLLDSPVPIILIVSGYIYSVLSLGPKLMKHRKPFHLKTIITIYNVFQVLFNTVFVIVGATFWTKYYGLGLSCIQNNEIKYTSTDEYLGALTFYFYFINKVIDLMDTVFFVLRKKNKHISNLHVFHHAVMPILAWICVKFYVEGNHVIIGLINSFVHVWMYTYYLLANMGPEYQKYIWWKRHLTELQLFQFVFVGIYMTYVCYMCDVARPFIIGFYSLDIIFIILFANFYIKTYRMRKSNAEEKKMWNKAQ